MMSLCAYIALMAKQMKIDLTEAIVLSRGRGATVRVYLAGGNL